MMTARKTRYLVASAAALMLVAGCEQVGSQTVAEFTGPNPKALVIDYKEPCADDRSSVEGDLAISGEGFEPGERVELSWDDVAVDQHGEWPKVMADRTGEIAVTLTPPSDVLSRGSALDIWAQGPGPEGILALRGVAKFGDC